MASITGDRAYPSGYVMPVPKTAAVAPISDYQTVAHASPPQGWQQRVMDLIIEGPGVIGFALNLKSDVCALGRMHIAEPDRSGNWRKVQNPKEQAILHAYRGVNGETREELFRRQVFHEDSIGEWNLGSHNTECGPRYEVIAKNQLHPDAGHYGMVALSDEPWSGRRHREDRPTNLRYLPEDQVVRVWCPHPYWPELAHSAMRRALSDIDRLTSATRRIKRVQDSRLVNNDVIWLAAEAAMQYAAMGGPKKRADFHRDFARHAHATYTDQGGPEEVAPFTLSTGYQFGPPIKLDMGSPITEWELEAENAAYRAIGRALDLPMRIFFESETGGNHWSDWLTESQFIRTSVQPTGQKACDNLTTAWLRPMYRYLQSTGWIDPDIKVEDRRIVLDMSGVLKNPDESKILMEAYRYGIPSRETVAKRGLNLTEDEIMELPTDYDDFKAWASFVARPVGGRPMGPDAFEGDGPPDTAKLASAMSAARDRGVPPELLAQAIHMARLHAAPEQIEAHRETTEEILESAAEYLDHEGYGADADLLALL